jgi:hypothetical protein
LKAVNLEIAALQRFQFSSDPIPDPIFLNLEKDWVIVNTTGSQYMIFIALILAGFLDCHKLKPARQI